MADRPKIGAGHLAGMGRLGLKELQAVTVNPGSNVAQPPEPGVWGNPTPGEVAAARGADAAPGRGLGRDR